MVAENIIKGRIAGLIVSLMLQESGYIVLRYGFEGVPEIISQLGTLKKHKSLNLLRSTPQFVILDPKKETILLSVRYQGERASGRNVSRMASELSDFWPYTCAILVRQKFPFFYLVDVGSDEKLTTTPLYKSKVIKVNEPTIKKYGILIRKFLNK